MSKFVSVYVCVVLWIIPGVFSNWWFLSKLQLSSTANPRLYCDHIPGLDRRQRQLCLRHPDNMIGVAYGALMGVRECQYQFRNQRWNCSTVDKDASVFGKSLEKIGSKEAAFVYAISSAGVVHAISRACSKGDIANCACDSNRKGSHKDTQGEFSWGGCSENVRYGITFARKFVDAREKRQRDARALMNMHNNRAGRKAVVKNMKLECKCHGVSGACTVRTCWLATPDFRQVGQYLKRRYDEAAEVTVAPAGSTLVLTDYFRRQPKEIDLIYFENSPDYCSTDPLRGSLGTEGRVCNKSSAGPDGCEVLCCGRGYDTRRVLVTRQCECKFQWCCFVQCNTCKEWVDEHRCKSSSIMDNRAKRSAAAAAVAEPKERKNLDELLRSLSFRPSKSKVPPFRDEELFRLEQNRPFPQVE